MHMHHMLTHPLISTVLQARFRILPVHSYAIMGQGGKLGSNAHVKWIRGPKQLINKDRKLLRLAGVLHPILGFSLVVGYTI